MRYSVYVVDVHGDWHQPENGVPSEGGTPWEVFEKILSWCRAENVMPENISVE